MGFAKDFLRFLVTRDPVDLCVNHAQRHNGFAKLPLPGRRGFWVITDPAVLDDVLRLHSNSYDKGGPIFDVIGEALGREGLFTVNNRDTWKRLRVSMNPAFAKGNLESPSRFVTQVMSRRIRSWDGKKTVHMFQEFKTLNVELLIDHLFGYRTDAAEIVALAQPVFEGMATRVFLPAWMPGARSYRKRIAALDDRVFQIIQERRDSTESHDDLLGRLMSASDPGFNDQQLRDQVFTLFMAGFDSTATGMAWACVALAEDRVTFEILSDEVRETIGNREPTFSDIEQLPELQKFARSVFESHPSFPLFFRNVAEKSELAGQTVNEGDQLILAPRFARIPFGKGNRKCIGEDMATMTSIVTLILLLQHCKRIRRVPRNSGGRRNYAMTAPPKDGAHMIIDLRD